MMAEVEEALLKKQHGGDSSDTIYGQYTNIYSSENEGLLSIGGKVLYVVQMIGYSVSVITLIVIGIQYVTKSPDGKAQIKDRLVMYTIGAAILFGATTFISIIANFGNGLFN